jgi:acetyl-CoA carboxylase biotin carboxyl carrier protein
MAQWDEQVAKLKQIIEIMKEHNLVEVQIKQGEDEIAVKKGQAQQPQIAAVPVGIPTVLPGAAMPATPQAQASSTAQENLVEIKSPLVGTFYAQPSPDSEPFVEVGSHVDANTVVCIIEAMKVMNEIKAESAGTIVEVVAVSGEAAEYGQVLFRVRPD